MRYFCLINYSPKKKTASVMNGGTMKKSEELAKPELTAELSECFSCLEG